MTHGEMTLKAVAWLRASGYKIVLSEFVCWNVHETPDALGWKGDGWSCLVEVKTSRADFKRDAEKLPRRHREYSVGQRRFYLTPTGLVAPAEVPDGWGLLGVSGRSAARLVKGCPVVAKDARVALNEMPFLIAALSRADALGFDINAPHYKAAAAEAKRKAQPTLDVPLSPTERDF